ncbi:MAG: hypothetical protein LBG81_03870 [Coriobacteriaceae bacterium]|jgi:hypothetical protein|nr:hypothetical protein [Coriobacteriaceae bacterium]
MKDIKALYLEKYNDKDRFSEAGEGVFRDLQDTRDTCYRIALSYELEEGDSGQYPLEDVLDKYYLYVSDFLGTDIDSLKPGDTVTLELGGEEDDVRKATALAGKRVYNTYYTKEDGKEYAKLVIE